MVPLQWDSEFFGYPIAKVIINSANEKIVDEVFDEIHTNKYRLTYFFIKHNEDSALRQMKERKCKLVDNKVTYGKKPISYPEQPSHIVEYESDEPNASLINLALQAGVFSRFRIDTNFTKNDYERLYTAWLEKSIRKELACKILVSMYNDDITGFATLVFKENLAEIGLAAVSYKYRGQKIGYDLVRKVESLACESGMKKIRIITQKRNKPAINLYKKCNYVLEDTIDIFHYWL